MVLIIFRLVMIIFILTNGFRPLAGIMVLIYSSNDIKYSVYK